MIPKEKKLFEILVLPPQDKPVYFIIPAWHDDAEDDDPEATKFLFEERQCPHDIIMNCEAIIVDGDTDPHGLFEHVRSIQNPGPAARTEDWWRSVLPEAFEGSGQ